MIDVQLDISYISLIYTRLMHDIYAVRYTYCTCHQFTIAISTVR